MKEVDAFLEFSCFSYDPMNVRNLISGSSAFSKSSLYIWKLLVHILLKPILENFEHYFANMWDECSCTVVWAFSGIAIFGIGMKTDLFQSYGYCWVFQICWHIECSIASSFRIWNSSTGIPSPPLALFIVMFPKAHLTLQSWMSGSKWLITPWTVWRVWKGKEPEFSLMRTGILKPHLVARGIHYSKVLIAFGLSFLFVFWIGRARKYTF